MGEGANGWLLRENELVNLTVSRWHFLLLPICEMYNEVIGLLGGMLQIHRARSMLKDNDQ